jgi:hypothetical protein
MKEYCWMVPVFPSIFIMRHGMKKYIFSIFIMRHGMKKCGGITGMVPVFPSIFIISQWYL